MSFTLLSTPVDDIKNIESVPDQKSDINPNKNKYTFPSRSSTSSKVTEKNFGTYTPNLSPSPSPSSPKSLLPQPLSSQSLPEIKNKTKTRVKGIYNEYSAKNAETKYLSKENPINIVHSEGFDIQNILHNDTLKNSEAFDFEKENQIDDVADSSNADLLEFLSDDSENSNDNNLSNLGFQAVELSSEPDFEITSILKTDDEIDSNKVHENESLESNLNELRCQEQKTELNNNLCSENIVPEVIEQLDKIASESKQNQIVKASPPENKQMIRNIKSYNWYDRARGKSSIFPSSNLEDYKNGIQFGKKTNAIKLIGHNSIEIEQSQELVKYNKAERQRKQPRLGSEFELESETEIEIESESKIIKPKRIRHLKRKHVIEDDSYTDLLIEKFANKPKSKNLKQIGTSKAVSDLGEVDVYKPKKKVTLKKLMKDGRRKRYDYKVHVNPDTLPSFITQFMEPPDV